MRKKIPLSVKKLFWDVDKHSVDMKKHASYIMKRVLDYGDCKEVLWMQRHYSVEEITETIKKSRGITKKTAYYIASRYRVPEKESRCLRNTSPEQHTPH